MLHLEALVDIARSLVFPSPVQTETIVDVAQGLMNLVTAQDFRQVTGLLAFCHTFFLFIFHLRPLLVLLRDHFNIRVDDNFKLIPLSSSVICGPLTARGCGRAISLLSI